MPNGKSKAIRTPLTATRLDDAIAEAEKSRTEKCAGNLHLPGRRPKFSELVISNQTSRATGGAANRTINLDVTAFNNAMQYAADFGQLSKTPKIRK